MQKPNDGSAHNRLLATRDVHLIRELRDQGVKTKVLAGMFNVGERYIRKIVAFDKRIIR